MGDAPDDRRERGALSRRAFLATAATAAGALGASACATGAAGGAASEGEHGADGERWDEETDVVVVGAGTGVCGALAAATGGARVLVLEKRAGPGGNTAMSGGVAWIPNNHCMAAAGIADSRENALTYLRKLRLDQADDALLEAFVDAAPEMARFVEATTSIRWRVSTIMGKAADYHPEWPGGVRRGRSIEPTVDAPGMYGLHLVSALVAGATAAGAELRTRTPVERLVTRDAPDGAREVRGVVALRDGAPWRIRARRGVLLAAGGFDWNFDMKRHFLRGMSPFPLGSPGNTGDGVRMAMQAGADLRNMNEAWGMTVYAAEARANQARGIGPSLSAEVEKRAAGSIVVNRYGERFANEAGDYDSTWRTYFSWENWGELAQRNLPAFALFDARVRRDATIAGRRAGEPLPDWVVEAPTLAALAAKLGIDAPALEATVRAFNRHARDGRDPRFHRGESHYDRFGEDDVRGVLGPLAEPPFYGAELAVGDIGTCGGPRVDPRARVLDPFGRWIRGLYASGNNAGIGSPGASYGGGGGTIGPALTFAYLAGRELGSTP
ncbi:MAG: FAD-binding protein [Myxococcota bacterium]